jgi:putative hydrolase
MLDLRVDGHAHTGFATGGAGVGLLVTAAERASLARLTFADPVGPETTWLRAYLDSIRRAQRRTDLVLRSAIEVEAVRPDGWIAFPADLGELEAVSVALSQVPLHSGLATSGQVRELLRTGAMTAGDVAELVITATARAIERSSRYAPTQLARPLSTLAALGIDEADVPESAVGFLAAACRATGVPVEISEAWRSPSIWLARSLAAAGVPFVAASDTSDANLLGQWRYVHTVQAAIDTPPT